jgi:hypothetical protein
VKTAQTILLGGLLSGLALGTTSTAGAATMSMTFTGLGPNKTLKLNYNAGRSFNQNASGGWQNYSAGKMKWTSAGKSVNTFCTQIAENISNGQTVNYTVTALANVPDPVPGPMGAIRAQLVMDLYAKNFAAVKASSDSKLNAAFQLAIWEITHENINAANAAAAVAQLNVGTGALAVNLNNSATAQVAAIAAGMLADLGENGFQQFGSILGLTDPLAQDQIIVVPIPVPAAIAGIGLLVAARLRRRMK